VSDLVGNGGSMRVIPEDLQQEYGRAQAVLEFGQSNDPDRWKLQIQLIERIADLSAEVAMLKKHCPFEEENEQLRAENARLKQPVTAMEWSMAHIRAGFNGIDIVNELLASRSKEPKGATE
jgi:hypothetical protein